MPNPDADSMFTVAATWNRPFGKGTATSQNTEENEKSSVSTPLTANSTAAGSRWRKDHIQAEIR